MSNCYDYLFLNLDKMGISIDKDEFLFQIQSNALTSQSCGT